MDSNQQHDFTVEYVAVGPFAHGFGRTVSGHPYAFRVVRRTLRVEIYRNDLDNTVPAQEDVVARAEGSVTEIDLTDERSIIGLVRDLVGAAQPVDSAAAGEETTVRAFLSRISSVIDAI